MALYEIVDKPLRNNNLLTECDTIVLKILLYDLVLKACQYAGLIVTEDIIDCLSYTPIEETDNGVLFINIFSHSQFPVPKNTIDTIDEFLAMSLLYHPELKNLIKFLNIKKVAPLMCCSVETLNQRPCRYSVKFVIIDSPKALHYVNETRKKEVFNL